MTLIDRHLKRLRARHEISAAEEAAIRSLTPDARKVPARTIVIRDGDKLTHSTLLLDGLLCRYKDLRNGQRQVTEIHVPGDYADMHSFTLKRLDHNVRTLCDSVLALASHDRIREVIEEFPRIGRLFWFGTNLDAANHREWELSLGQRTANARIAHLFCEMQVRLAMVDLADETGFDFPVTQAELGEFLGLTSVHVNRVLRQLREAKVATFKSGRVAIHDLAGLQQAADFDPGYLYLDPEPI